MDNFLEIMDEINKLRGRSLNARECVIRSLLLDPDLSEDDRVFLLKESLGNERLFSKNAIRKLTSKSPIIPCKHCMSEETKKFGIVHGKQRYQCNTCKKTFLRG